jgi:transaldolase
MDKPRNSLRQLQDLGQSVWLDYIRRHLLGSNEFRRMLDEDGLRGMTSNPTIFEKAIAGSTDYDEQLKQLAPSARSIDEIYEALSIADIQMAADALRPIYDQSEGRFGFVSYEVSPLLANETDETIAAAHRYFDLIGRPNLMIKVPATPAGIPAIEQLISEGRNINITLMFSMRHYDAVAEAYIRGLEKRMHAGQPVDRVASVASVFVSRIDTLVDKRIGQAHHPRRSHRCSASQPSRTPSSSTSASRNSSTAIASARCATRARAFSSRYGHRPAPRIRTTATSNTLRN